MEIVFYHTAMALSFLQSRIKIYTLSYDRCEEIGKIKNLIIAMTGEKTRILALFFVHFRVLYFSSLLNIIRNIDHCEKNALGI